MGVWAGTALPGKGCLAVCHSASACSMGECVCVVLPMLVYVTLNLILHVSVSRPSSASLPQKPAPIGSV